MKSGRIYYGWIIVAVAFLIGFTQAGVFQNILSIFLKPMASDFGWSRTSITGAMAFGSICGGLAGPFVGPLLDRHGPRMVAFWGILTLSTGLASLYFLSRIWQLYLFFGAGRMIAVGMLSLVIAVMVSNWFRRHRGRAMGIAQLGSRAGTAVFPPFVQFMILSHGWRLAWAALGAVVFLLSAVPSVLFLKRRPEDIGLRPDGDPVSVTPAEEVGHAAWGSPDDDGEPVEPVWTGRRAFGAPVFWLLVLLSCLLRFSGAGINFHLYPFMTDRGVSAATAVMVISTAAVSMAAGGLLLGFFAERFRIRVLLAGALAALGLSFLSLFWAVGDARLLFAFSVFYGVLRGGVIPLVPLIWAECFGRGSLGTVLGLSSPFRLTANALGPVFGAICFDSLGGYAVPYAIFAGLLFAAGILALFIKPGRR